MNVLAKVPRLARRPLAEAILELAESNRPGSKVIAALHLEQRRLEPQFLAELEKEFHDLGHWMAMVVEGQGGLLLEADRPGDEGRIMRILQRANLNQWTKEHLAPLFQKQWRRVLDSTVLTLNRNQVPVQLNNHMAQALIDIGARRIGLLDIEEDTKRALLNILTAAREAGLDPRSTAKMIEDKVPAGRFVNAGPKYRAELIARTETLNAQRYSSLKCYEESPVVKEVEASDGEGDPVCAFRNGNTFSFEEAANELNNTHPNCVLCFGPVV